MIYHIYIYTYKHIYIYINYILSCDNVWYVWYVQSGMVLVCFHIASYAFHHGYTLAATPWTTSESHFHHRQRRVGTGDLGKFGESSRLPRGKFRTSAANVHLVAMMLPLPLACLHPQERSNLFRLSSNAEAQKGFFSLL